MGGGGNKGVWVTACRMPASSSAHLGWQTEHGRAQVEKVGHLSSTSMVFGSSLAGRKVKPGPTCYHIYSGVQYLGYS
eukprot:6283201-Prymnesium_polylepis.1